MDESISYRELDQVVTEADEGAWYAKQGIAARRARGHRMLPNVLQYPDGQWLPCCAPATPSSMSTRSTRRENCKHQLCDSGAEAIIVLENFATTWSEQMLAKTSGQACNRGKPWATCSASSRARAGQFCRSQCQENGARLFAAERHRSSTRCCPEGARLEARQAGRSSREDIAFLQLTGGTRGVSRRHHCSIATSSPTCCKTRLGSRRR